MTPPPSKKAHLPFPSSRTSLEGEPKIGESEIREKPRPKTPQQLAEEKRTAEMRVVGEAARSQAKLSLEGLEGRIKSRSYDRETPRLITEIKLEDKAGDSPEIQAKFDALSMVSSGIITALIHGKFVNPAELGGENLTNDISIIEENIANIIPGAVENAALHKLQILRSHKDSPATKSLQNEWRSIVQYGKKFGQEIAPAMQVDVTKPLPEKDKWTLKGFIHQYPKISGAVAVGAAIGIGFGIWKLWKWLRRSDEKTATAPGASLAPEKPRGAWGFFRWLVFGLSGAGLIGWILHKTGGLQKVIEWAKGLGVSAKDTLASLMGDNPDYNKNKELYDRMAKCIGEEQGISINASFLAYQAVNVVKFKDIIDDESWWKKYALDNPVGDAVASGLQAIIPGQGTPIYTQEQRTQMNALRGYLQNPERQKIISRIPYDDQTTLAEMLVKIDAELNKQKGTPPLAPDQTSPEVAAKNPDEALRAFLETNYGAISAENLRQLYGVNYKTLMEQHRVRGIVHKLKTGAQEGAAEIGLGEAPTADAQNRMQTETVLRSFFEDNAALITSFNLPVGATVGMVLGKLMEAGIDKFAVREAVTAALHEQPQKITDAQVEGISERDEASKLLPVEKQRTYAAQRRMLEDLRKSDNWLDTDQAQKLIGATFETAAAVRHEASGLPDKTEIEKQQRIAQGLERKAQQLKVMVNRRTQALAAYTQGIKSNAPEKTIDETFRVVLRENERVLQASALLEEKISEESRLKHVAALAALQLPRAAYIYFTRPEHYRSFVRNHYGPFGLVPSRAISRWVETRRRPRGGIELTRTRIKEGESRLYRELGGGDLSGEGSLKQRANLDTPYTGLSDKFARQARQRYDDELSLLEHDKKLLKAEEGIELAKQEIADLKSKNTPPNDLMTQRIQNAERELTSKIDEAKLMRRQRLKLESKALSEASEDLYGRVASDLETPWQKREWMQIDDLARRGAEYKRELASTAENIIDQIVKEQKAGASPARIAALKAELDEVTNGISKFSKDELSRFGAFMEEIRRSRHGKVLKPEDQKKFRQVLAKMFHWQREAGGKEVKLRATTFKGKFYFYGLTLGIASAVGIATKDKNTSWARAGGQAALDVAPITGTLSDFYTALSGKEYISKRRVTGYERFLLRPLFGMVGLASDILLLAGGIGLGGRAALSGVRGGVEAARMAKIAKAAGKVTAKEAAEKAAGRAAAESGAEAATRTATRGGATEAAEETSRLSPGVKKALERLRTGGTVAGVSLGVGGLVLSLVKTDEMDIPPSIHELAGGPDGQLEEIDIENLGSEVTLEAPAETSEDVRKAG